MKLPLLLALFSAFAAWSATTGSISGTVTDPSGSASVRVEVTKASADVDTHVDAVATHLGEAVSQSQIEALRLNGRSHTDLPAIQPGVRLITTLTATSVILAGVILMLTAMLFWNAASTFSFTGSVGNSGSRSATPFAVHAAACALKFFSWSARRPCWPRRTPRYQVRLPTAAASAYPPYRSRSRIRLRGLRQKLQPMSMATTSFRACRSARTTSFLKPKVSAGKNGPT